MDVQGFMQRWGILLLIAAGAFVVGFLLFGRKALKGASGQTAPAVNIPGASATDANGNPVVEYLPTTGDSYTNVNYSVGAQTNSNNVNSPTEAPVVAPGGTVAPVTTTTTTNEPTRTINNGPVTTTGPISGSPIIGGPITVPPAPPPFIPIPHPPTPNPPAPVAQPQPQPAPVTPPPGPRTRTYTIVHGDTLSGIARNVGTTWQILYNMNSGTINQWASEHHNPIPGGPWNNIFPGEQIQVPA